MSTRGLAQEVIDPVHAMLRRELAGAAAWSKAWHATRLLTVSLAPPMRCADAGRAHAMTERGELPRLAGRTADRMVLRP
ncbi:MAG TPA: hypothetical protein VFV73_25760 [Streptosporangiaceae bacterium]|nr:hypothetical protein [Streptosporangiaceae bacterium]